MNYTPLYIKTDNSIMQSLIKISDLIDYALKNNLKSLAIADDNLYGAMDFYMLSIKNNIKPIIGLELNIENEKLVLYCMNFNGYQNLLKINKIKSEREINLNDLLLYKDNLICLVPYEYEELYFKINKIYDKCFRTYKNLEEKNNIKEISLYMNETLCLTKSDIDYLKYLNSDRKYFDNYLHLEEELKKYNDLNNNIIFDLCNLEIPLNQNLMPKFKNKEGIDSYEYLKKKCINGLKEKFGVKVSKQYQERLKYELEVINNMNFCDYFLIVADYVLFAKQNNVIVGPGRGSVVGSLVAYLLNITEVDPIKNNLMFERFLNSSRITMPDIDIDFEHIKREDVIDYCIKKYGELNVVPIITFGTMGVKQTLKEAANKLNIDEFLIENFIKNLDLNISLKENYKNKKVIEYIKVNNLELLAKLSLKFEGLKHHVSIHAAGVVMSNNALTDIIPVVNYNGKYISGIDMTYLEDIGLLKMDFLAIKYLTIIHEMIDEINEAYNINLKFNEIPNNDKLSLEVFKTGDTLGIFQFESEGMIEFLKKLKPDTFEDICVAMALYRPGPMKNIDKYIEAKNNPSKVKYILPELEEILKPTNGILIYQEQIIEMAQKVANYSKKDADLLRKAMSKKKKDILAAEEEKFIEGCIKNNINQYNAKQIFDLMLKFAEYGFNKAHSCGYSLVSYRMAYLKAHYKHIFMSKLLTMEMNDKSKLKKYIYECKKNDINILKPNINESSNKFIKKDADLLFPLSGIKEINNAIALNIIEERKKGLFKDIYDFIKRCNIKGNIIENLIKSGAFECFNINQKTLIENIDLILNYGELIKDIDEEYALKPLLKEHNDYDIKEKLKNEISILGIYLSNHPTTEYKNKYKNIVDLNDLSNYFDKDVNVIGYVDSIREIMTKKNEKMCFVNMSDELSTIDVVIFPKNYEKNANISEGDVLLINGKVEKRFEKNQIIVNKMKKIN